MKKSLSFFLCFIMLIGNIVITNGNINKTFSNTAYASEVDFQVGDTINYGTYPQTDVTESMGTVLNEQAGTWVSYNYYTGTGEWCDGQMTASDFMRYKDVTYNNEKYRAVIFDTYRPMTTYDLSTETSSNYQNRKGYKCGQVYWFRFEPIKWRVLDPSSGLVMSEMILDSQPFSNYIRAVMINDYSYYQTYKYYNDVGKYASDYETSSIRKWLNEDFYNAAFTSSEKANIKTTHLDNRCYLSLTGNPGYEEFDSADTNDNVFLLSYEDMTSESYGFSDSTIGRLNRQAKGTNYSHCQGLASSDSDFYSNNGFRQWMLRTSGDFYYRSNVGGRDKCLVSGGGGLSTSQSVELTHDGIRPAICLSEIRSTHGYELGKDTYGFDNYSYYNYSDYGCSSLHAGHCFGMAASSSGFYLGVISKGANYDMSLYEFPDNKAVRSIICHYQWLQGSAAQKAIVAGDQWFIDAVCIDIPFIDFFKFATDEYNYVDSDWPKVVNYVKNHYYDYAGNLLVDIIGKERKFHELNFLYYKEVGGEERIYVYDNIYPEFECYITQNNEGSVVEYTDEGNVIDTILDIGLISSELFFNEAGYLETRDMVFAPIGTVSIENSKEYPFRTDSNNDDTIYESFEFPYGTEVITIVPLVDNAQFIYMGELYSFDKIDGDTVATLKLSTSEEKNDAIFEISDKAGTSPDKPEDSSNSSEYAKPDFTNFKIKNYNNYLSVDYKSTVIFHTTMDAPEGYEIVWSNDDKGSECKLVDITEKEYTVSAKMINKATGETIATTEEATVKVNTGFFAKIIAFFRNLFGSLPTYEDFKKK